MFNNVALDIAIGLVFIYLLYSLLATTVKEFIATLFDYRARMLERGLEQMLDGKNHSYYWWDRVWNFFNKSNKEKTTSKFYQKTHLFTASISCHPLYVRAGGNSRFSKKPSYLPSDVFSDILVDILKTDGQYPLLKDIEANIKAKANDPNNPLNRDLEKILLLHVEQANGDLQRFRLIAENWYNDTMDRVGGWYKKQANYILLLIGLIAAIIFNVNTLEIVNILSSNSDVREKLANNATAYIQSKQQSLSSPTIPSDSMKAILANDTTFQNAKKSLAKIDSLYNKEIKDNNTLIGLGWGDYGYAEDSIQYTKAPAGTVKAPEHPGTFGKILYILGKTFSSPHRWLGFLLTALAISLGAPFWFDLLNRFVNLRVAGTKPDDKKSTRVSKTSLLNQKPDPTAKG